MIASRQVAQSHSTRLLTVQQCLKWRSSSDGGFKRFMTVRRASQPFTRVGSCPIAQFSYIISVPLLVTYSVAMAGTPIVLFSASSA